ncbi:serine/arginine repetitive matrix protein 1-like isoform X2 [Acanthaster planci]|uniref:Serine/arginine repetitive matrix protein 1-like isoform X2 n=1 Tax=Acanthaster planci TaxID=133434 RepID=A0A8B7Z938_ACAPL|nr:serine/arginine repetitive matrix protein 1-like isoform X2 [Acanthaster planci]
MSTALKVKIERSLSVPRARDDSDIKSDDDAEAPHPGHRFFTPQPDRKKPLLLPKPRASIPAVSPKIREGDEKHNDKESSPKAKTHDDTKEVEDRENDSVPNGHLPANEGTGARKTARLTALRAASTMEPLIPKRKAPSQPPLSKRRTSDTQLQVIEQLMKRNEALKHSGSSTLKPGFGKKVARSASSAGLLSPSSSHERHRGSRHQFLTPQPTRRKFNLVDRTPSFNDGSPVGPVARLALKNKRLTSHNSSDSAHSPDLSPSPSPHTPVSPLAAPAYKTKKMASQHSSDSGLTTESSPSPTPHTPVSPLAAPAFKIKKLNSQQSSDSGLSSDLSSSPSPLTPVSPLAAPAFSGRMRQTVRPAPAIPEGQQNKIDFHQWKGPDKEKQWTKPEKSNTGSKDGISRNRPISMPNNIRRVSRGSVNKSKQRQSAVRQVAARQLASTVRPPVSSPAIGRSNSSRQRHQSAPAGRVALALKHDPTTPVTSLTGGESQLNTAISKGIRRRHASDSLRKEVLRSVSIEKSRKMSLMSDDGRSKEEVTPLGKADFDFRQEMVRMKSGHDQPDASTQALNGSAKSSMKRFVSADNRSVYSDYPSTFSDSPGGSPTRQRPKLRRGRSSRTSLGSLKSMLASNEFLNDIFLSDRKSHRKLKGIVGALAGLVLGGFLFLGLYYGLEYSLVASIVMTSIATIIMSMTLAFTVRARCVAALMIPTLCTSRGRAAFLALIVTLLLTGPIDNIYTNAKVASDSMSCSAELAQNQTVLIRDAAREIFDVYIRTLEDSVRKLQDAAAAVQDAFEPVENALNDFVEALGEAKEAVRVAASHCKQIINGAYKIALKELTLQIEIVRAL